jgi:magnesium transporter
MLTIYPNEKSTNQSAMWVDLLNPSDAELATAGVEYGIAIPSRGQLEEIESSSRLRSEGDALILSMPIASISDKGETMPTPIGFVLTPHLFVTVRFAELHAIGPAIEKLNNKTAPTSAEMFVTLIEAMVDYAADLLEKIASELNAISRHVFSRYGRGRQVTSALSNRALKVTLVEVGDAGDQLSHIRDSILGLQRITPYVTDKGGKWVDESVRERLKAVNQDVQSLTDFEVHLTDKLQFLLDAVLGFINTEQNDIFRVLTIVSVVGIPPTFIASMYGMNFDTIHEYHWHYGYAWGLGLIIASAIVPTAWFKWRGWW